MEPSTISLPPPPTFAGAPGQQQYDPNQSNGGTTTSHMPPPPLPPVVIPQNNNPVPASVTSPGDLSASLTTPGGGVVRRAAPEPNKRALYVGGLDPRVTEDILRQIFETTGHVTNVKIIPDKNLGAVRTTILPRPLSYRHRTVTMAKIARSFRLNFPHLHISFHLHCCYHTLLHLLHCQR